MPRRSSGNCVRWCLVVFAIASALCVCGPALYWKFNKAAMVLRKNTACSPCDCDSHCPPPLSLFKIAPGLVNLTVTDCGMSDPDLNEEMEKRFVDLLSEEMKLQEAVAEENLQRMNVTLNEARRLGCGTKGETEKCNAATEACEQARERAQALMTKERKLTSMWERRARQLGWGG